RTRLRHGALGARAGGAGVKSWPVGRSVLCDPAGGRRGGGGGGTGPVRHRGRQGALGPRKRTDHLRQFRAAVDAGLHRHHRQAQRVRLYERRPRAEAPAGSSRARAGICRTARWPLGRGHPAGADRAGRAQLAHDPEKWEPVFGKDHAPQETLMTPTRSRAGSGRLAALAVLALALFGCAEATRFDLGERVPLREPPAKHTAEAAPAAREHQRILAAYGGAYHDARLEALITHTVERLVAASEKPDLRYKVTILNSPPANAFALATGQLYVTRGLLALANDTSELASVLAHEMGHVIARHAAIREEQLRQAELVSQVASDVFKDPQVGALALAKNKLALATF